MLPADNSIMQSKTVIVIPCYNEARRLKVNHYLNFLKQHSKIDLIMVNDGSSDQTLALLQTIRQDDPKRCMILNLDHNSGKGEAVRRGITEALASGADYVGYWDADLSTPLETIPKFGTILSENPELFMVFGARVLLLGRTVERKALRHYCGRGFATLVSLMLNIQVYDTQCGAKLFRAAPEIKRIFENRFISRWVFDVEIIARWMRLCQTDQVPPVEKVIYEYPLTVWRHVAESKIKFSDSVTVARDLYKINSFLHSAKSNV